MPVYSYYCTDCKVSFELFSYIKDYQNNPPCCGCKNSSTIRLYVEDAKTQLTSVKKSDSELKTIGDLARRNSDRMSDDQKQHLYHQHNSYKDEKFESKPLPQGMKYINKPPKPVWTDNKQKKRRSKNK